MKERLVTEECVARMLASGELDIKKLVKISPIGNVRQLENLNIQVHRGGNLKKDEHGNVLINDPHNKKYLVEEREMCNLVTTVGKGLLSGLLLTDIGGTACDYIAVGTGTNAAAAGDT
jgi:hypothetical protein